MVCSGKPQCGITAHTLPADKNILQGLVKGVTHMELSRNVGRWNYNSVGLFLGVSCRLEAIVVYPEFVYFILYFLGVIELRQFSFH